MLLLRWLRGNSSAGAATLIVEPFQRDFLRAKWKQVRVDRLLNDGERETPAI